MKKNGKVKKTAAVALLALASKLFLETENQCFYDDPYDTCDFIVEWSFNEKDKHAARRLAAAAVPTCQQQGIIITEELFLNFSTTPCWFSVARV